MFYSCSTFPCSVCSTSTPDTCHRYSCTRAERSSCSKKALSATEICSAVTQDARRFGSGASQDERTLVSKVTREPAGSWRSPVSEGQSPGCRFRRARGARGGSGRSPVKIQKGPGRSASRHTLIDCTGDVTIRCPSEQISIRSPCPNQDSFNKLPPKLAPASCASVGSGKKRPP